MLIVIHLCQWSCKVSNHNQQINIKRLKVMQIISLFKVGLDRYMYDSIYVSGLGIWRGTFVGHIFFLSFPYLTVNKLHGGCVVRGNPNWTNWIRPLLFNSNIILGSYHLEMCPITSPSTKMTTVAKHILTREHHLVLFH